MPVRMNDPGGRMLRWEVINKSEDPTPGDVEQVERIKNYYRDLASVTTRAWERVKDGSAIADGEGEAMTALREVMDELPGMLEKAKSSYSLAADAYESYYTALKTGQEETRKAILNGEAAYEKHKANPDDEQAEQEWRDYVDMAQAAINEFIIDMASAASDLETAAQDAIPPRDFLEQVADFFSDNPWLQVAIGVVAGIVVMLCPLSWVGFAIAAVLGGLVLAIDIAQLIRADEFGWNRKTFITLGLGLLGCVPGGAVARVGAGIMRGGAALGRAGVTRSGTIGRGITSMAQSVRSGVGATAVGRGITNSRAWYSSVKAGAWRGPKVSIATQFGISGTQDFAMGLGANYVVKKAMGEKIDTGQLLLETAATTLPGSAVGSGFQHYDISFNRVDGFNISAKHNGDVLPTSMGVNDMSPDMSPSPVTEGNFDGVTSDFSGGSGEVTTPEGVQTNISTDTGGAPNVQTTTPDGLTATSGYDSAGDLSTSQVSTGNPGSGEGYSVSHDLSGGSPETTVTTPAPDTIGGDTGSPTATTADSSGVTSSGDFGTFSFDRSGAAPDQAPTAHYDYSDPASPTPEAPDFQADFPGTGSAEVSTPAHTGDGPQVSVDTTPEALNVTTPDTSVEVTTTPDGATATSVGGTDGAPAPSYHSGDQRISVPTGGNADASATHTGHGAALEGPDGTTVTTSDSAAVPTDIRPGGSGGPDSIQHRAGEGTVEAHTGDSISAANHHGDVLVASQSGDTTLAQSAGGAGSATAAGAAAHWSSSGTASYSTAGPAGAPAGHRSASGEVTFGNARTQPDGTVQHPDFSVDRDGTLTIRDGDGNTWSFDTHGNPLSTSAPDAAPPTLGTDPDTGAPTFTAQDGTTVSLDANGPRVTTSDGWSVSAARGGDPSGNADITVTGPRDAGGDRLSLTHGADGGLRAEGGGYALDTGNGSTAATTPEGAGALSHGAGEAGVQSGDWRANVTGAGAEVTHPGGRIDLDTQGGASLSGGHDGTGAPAWQVRSDADGDIGGTTGSGTDVTASREGDVTFGNGDTQVTRASDGELTVNDGNGLTVTQPTTGSAAHVDAGPGRPAVDVGPEGSTVTSPDGGAHHVDQDAAGNQQVRINEGEPGQPTIDGNGTVRVTDARGSVAATAEGFDAHGANSHVRGGDGGTTIDTQQRFSPDSTVSHHSRTGTAPDAPESLVTVERDGATSRYDTEGTVQQSYDDGRPGAPSATRDSEGTTTVETGHHHRSSDTVSEGPTMRRNPESDTTTVEHDGFRMSQTRPDGPDTPVGTEVQPAPDAPVARHNPDGSSTVEAGDVSVHRSADDMISVTAGDRDTPRVEWEQGDGGATTTVRDGDGTPVLRRDPDGSMRNSRGEDITGDGVDATPDHPGYHVTRDGDGSVTLTRDGDPSTTIRFNGDGSTSYSRSDSTTHVDLSPTGRPTTTQHAIPDAEPTTTVRQLRKGEIEIDHRPSPSGREHSLTRMDRHGNAESRIRGTDPDGRATSWGVGIDNRGQATSVDQRSPNTNPVRLRPNGELKETSGLWENYLAGGEFRKPEKLYRLAEDGSDPGRPIVWGGMNQDEYGRMKREALNELRNDAGNLPGLLNFKSPEEAITNWLYSIPKGIAQARYANTPLMGEDSIFTEIGWKFAAETAKVHTTTDWETSWDAHEEHQEDLEDIEEGLQPEKQQ
ncbi:hypothetical protein [Salinactinospora qingdaonensis]|uniref:Uncharacterized protein n=1 Tax=Salinactinospora qingdaonensis TaxID=702744 RepID=A0ABP7F360_9ACTN